MNKISSRESGFAVPKFMFINICSLAKTKNRVRAVVALEADLVNNDIDVCVVSESHLKPEMPDPVVTTIIQYLEEIEVGKDAI
jgi:hypothetical protein